VLQKWYYLQDYICRFVRWPRFNLEIFQDLAYGFTACSYPDSAVDRQRCRWPSTWNPVFKDRRFYRLSLMFLHRNYVIVDSSSIILSPPRHSLNTGSLVHATMVVFPVLFVQEVVVIMWSTKIRMIVKEHFFSLFSRWQYTVSYSRVGKLEEKNTVLKLCCYLRSCEEWFWRQAIMPNNVILLFRWKNLSDLVVLCHVPGLEKVITWNLFSQFEYVSITKNKMSGAWSCLTKRLKTVSLRLFLSQHLFENSKAHRGKACLRLHWENPFPYVSFRHAHN